ncbi:oxamate carbamoyltransferase subunit AllG family protein [Arthrobacter sp. MA-N2]|uniref:oxamate carbamoyltransferase subunit AllG family protein n=1 Tax=Arthrobacter sp. MA-N2 TaxID=1101188 RepID=UPI000483603C|nr:DUF1116 domain-containing protein [Arthrobacter sp. MA-N2]
MNANELRAATAIMSVEPRWTGMTTLETVLPEAKRRKWLLHAGPPFSSWAEVPEPLRNSAMQACQLEGWADSEDESLRLLSNGDITLEPAQNHDCVVPLAGVISPGMALHVVEDGTNAGSRSYAAVNEGMQHCLRLGIRDPHLTAHHTWLNSTLALWLTAVLRETGPVDLLPLMRKSLELGDDGHNRTIAGSRLVTERLLSSATGETPPGIRDFLDSCPAFALNLWMAAAALCLRAAEGIPKTSAITRAGGNGVSFGIQIGAKPGVWFSCAAEPPRGPRERNYDGLKVLGAIGDSAVVDFFGMGGGALGHAPDTVTALSDYAPFNALSRPQSVMTAQHAALPIRTGVSCDSVLNAGLAPIVLLGMIEACGLEGRIGGGAYEPPLQLFRAAQISE